MPKACNWSVIQRFKAQRKLVERWKIVGQSNKYQFKGWVIYYVFYCVYGYQFFQSVSVRIKTFNKRNWLHFLRAFFLEGSLQCWMTVLFSFNHLKENGKPTRTICSFLFSSFHIWLSIQVVWGQCIRVSNSKRYHFHESLLENENSWEIPLNISKDLLMKAYFRKSVPWGAILNMHFYNVGIGIVWYCLYNIGFRQIVLQWNTLNWLRNKL